MTTNLNEIREEHRDFIPRIESLKETANLIDLASTEAVVLELEEAMMFLNRHLIPHAQAEEEVLYRAYDQVANSPWATDTMRRDHREVEKLTQELTALRLHIYMDSLTTEQKQNLRSILFGLHTLLRLHFKHEEELILPRLEAALGEEAAYQLITSLKSEERARTPAA
jgi:iron-sulfur cluster repair protein YtfE (RIC family)